MGLSRGQYRVNLIHKKKLNGYTTSGFSWRGQDTTGEGRTLTPPRPLPPHPLWTSIEDRGSESNREIFCHVIARLWSCSGNLFDSTNCTVLYCSEKFCRNQCSEAENISCGSDYGSAEPQTWIAALNNLSYIYLGSSVCLSSCHIPVVLSYSCHIPVIFAERWAILYVVAIKLTKETRRRVWRGRDWDGEIGDGEIRERGCE